MPVKQYRVALKTSHDTGLYRRGGRTFAYSTTAQKIPQVHVVGEDEIGKYEGDPYLEITEVEPPDEAA